MRQSFTALGMLTAGCVLAITALAWVGARVTGTLELAETTGGDFVSLYLLGDGTATTGALAAAIGTLLLLLAGVVTASVGYLRIANPGPSPLMIRNPGSLNPQPREMQLALKGKY